MPEQRDDNVPTGVVEPRTPLSSVAELPFGATASMGQADDTDRVLHSDPHDFAGLYIRHRSSFTLHARRYLRDQRDAEEVVQEAFLRLFLALPELETELQALAYCRRTITNLCIDRYRAQSRRPSLVALDSVPIEDFADEQPGDPVVRAEDAATVREALSLLSPLHRSALIKREIEEKPLPQIAAELEIPEDSVKHVLFRARRALRRILATTSLAPGADGELAGPLARAVTKGPAAIVALVLLLGVGLSTGPDLRSIPVAGAVLPDLPSITEVVRAVGEAVTGGGAQAPDVSAGGGGGASNAGGPQAFDGPGPLVALPGSTPSPWVLPESLAGISASATVGLLPASPRVSPSAVAPAPVAPLPVATASELPGGRPSPKPVVAEPGRGADPVEAIKSKPGGKGQPGAGGGAGVGGAPGSVTGSGGSRGDKPEPRTPAPAGTTAGSSAPSGKPSPPAAGKPSPPAAAPVDPDAWDTPGLVWQNDPKTQQPVLAPVGSAPGFDS